MTMPIYMNCSHMSDGWCLECVQKLDAELAEAKQAFTIQRENYLRLYGAIMEGGTQSSMLIDPVDVVKRLQAELAESKAQFEKAREWNKLTELELTNLRNIVDGQNADILSLQSHNAKLGEAILSKLPNTGGWDNACPFCGLKVPYGDLKHDPECIVNLLASQPDNELRDRVRAELELARTMTDMPTTAARITELLSSL